MSFPTRDRPRLSDRFRGKSGDEIMAELRQSMDEDRQKFFETPKWGRGPISSRFPKGFPFDDDLNSGRTRLEDHLDKIAQRHPEFADQLKGWANIEKRPRHDGPSGSEPSASAKEEGLQKEEDTGPIGGSNLRNTVPDMQHNQPTQDEIDRAQRSQSAPPESHQRQSGNQKDVSTQKNEGQNAQQNTSPPPQPQPQPQPQQNQQSRGPTVRHIPIHVEGRDEPLLPKEATGTSHHSQSHFQTPSPQPQQPSRPARKQPPKSAEPIHIPVQINPTQTQPPHHHHHHNNQQQQQQQQQQQTQEKSPTPPPQAQAPPPPPPRLDPLDQVAAIQKEVDELKNKIESNQSLNKGDREYIYLDEMLTRHLLKLDNIETEGREEVRTARKEAIKRIQDCINTLESMPDKKQTSTKSTETTS